MKKNFLALSFALLLVSTSSILHAQGNAEAGKTKAVSCAGCHGEEGNSTVGSFPKLAGQHTSYLIKQLQEFKNGTRNDAMMSAMALALTEQDIEDIAAYYAEQKTSIDTLPASAIEDEKQGSDLYRNGDLVREVSACIACHGPLGEGNKPAAFPALKSQHADYLIKTLTDYKNGVRSKNPENPMVMIAKKMTDEEIKDLAYHISIMR
ncbi:MAG: c-type cytochrome [Methylococcaceae bacterium]